MTHATHTRRRNQNGEQNYPDVFQSRKEARQAIEEQYLDGEPLAVYPEKIQVQVNDWIFDLEGFNGTIQADRLFSQAETYFGSGGPSPYRAFADDLYLRIWNCIEEMPEDDLQAQEEKIADILGSRQDGSEQDKDKMKRAVLFAGLYQRLQPAGMYADNALAVMLYLDMTLQAFSQTMSRNMNLEDDIHKKFQIHDVTVEGVASWLCENYSDTSGDGLYFSFAELRDAYKALKATSGLFRSKLGSHLHSWPRVFFECKREFQQKNEE